MSRIRIWTAENKIDEKSFQIIKKKSYVALGKQSEFEIKLPPEEPSITKIKRRKLLIDPLIINYMEKISGQLDEYEIGETVWWLPHTRDEQIGDEKVNRFLGVITGLGITLSRDFQEVEWEVYVGTGEVYMENRDHFEKYNASD